MRQRLKRRKRLSGYLIITCVCILVALWCGYRLYTFAGNGQPTGAADFIVYEVMPQVRINSANAILVDLEEEEILLDKNSAVRMYPASMTKIMTAVVALESLCDLNETIVLHEGMYSDIYEANAMTAGFLPGEEVAAIDLLYGLLLPSGAECAIGLAEHVAGSESAFAGRMNEKARELGMDGTHFVNATGLHDGEHYSTVGDMAALLEYALDNEVFYEIFTSARHSSRSTNLHRGGITYTSTLFANAGSADFDGGSILGGKTGYTEEAGQCLASLAEKDGKRYILVTCGAPGNRKTQNLHVDDAIAVYTAIK